MKNVLISVLSVVFVGCASKPAVDNQSKESKQSFEQDEHQTTESKQLVEKGELPTTCDGAIEAITGELDTDSVKTLRNAKKKDLVMFHFSWGMGIRNSYKLWPEDSPIRKSCAQSVGKSDIHPDDASGIIMEGVWRLVNGKGRW